MSSFMAEINAPKPGNVSRHSAGHGMTLDDFIRSAELTTPILCDPELSVGQRVLQSVKVTMSELACNTNLGMLLLFAPLVRSAELGVGALESNLAVVLEELERRDLDYIFASIRLANPGGLGASEKYDVHRAPPENVSVQQVMAVVKDRDLIAKQYVNGFSDIFCVAYPCLKEYLGRWRSLEWSTVGCYITLLIKHPDSHIVRKHGLEVAQWVQDKAAPIAGLLRCEDEPEELMGVMRKFDAELKKKGVNPGSSADLTAACLLVYHLKKL